MEDNGRYHGGMGFWERGKIVYWKMANRVNEGKQFFWGRKSRDMMSDSWNMRGEQKKKKNMRVEQKKKKKN